MSLCRISLWHAGQRHGMAVTRLSNADQPRRLRGLRLAPNVSARITAVLDGRSGGARVLEPSGTRRSAARTGTALRPERFHLRRSSLMASLFARQEARPM